VGLVRRKWPDSPHYEGFGVVLGRGGHGTWVGCKKGNRVKLPSGEERAGEYNVVSYVPDDDWFVMHAWHEHPEVELYVDICAPAVWSPSQVTVIDLDFDVIRWNAAKGGEVELVDEDEFEEHRSTLRYPEEIEAGARRAAVDVLDRVTRRVDPFNPSCVEPWLSVLLADLHVHRSAES